MRLIVALLTLCCIVALSAGQYVKTTIPLPDSVSGLTGVGSLVYHSPTSTMYVGGDWGSLVVVNARTNGKLRKVAVGGGPHLLCSDPLGNKVFCANGGGTVTVIDGATNQPVKTLPIGGTPSEMCYNDRENKLYCINAYDSLVRVIDCVGDSIVARVPVSGGSGALCYNSQLNRVYCASSVGDEVIVIDCAVDTVVSIIWVHGVEPRDICYDSGSNCVYTANSYSNTVSVIDCATDTFVRLVPVGLEPAAIIAGPPGKVYCANGRDSSVTVISVGGVKTVRTGTYPGALSYDPANCKVYCVSGYWSDSVTVIDATQDTVMPDIGTGSSPVALCYNPAGNNTYVACSDDDVVSVVGGVSDTVDAVIPLYSCDPGPLCYNTTNNHLYCLDQDRDLLFVIDGDSNRVLKTLRTGSGSDALIWNPTSNKVYIANSEDSTVSILDCVSDSIVATVKTGVYPRALCCSDDGKVYVANEGGGVAVVDGNGDSVRAVIPVGSKPLRLCYDRTDNKVYVGKNHRDTLSVIDAYGDSVVAAIPLPSWTHSSLCWNENHDKLYVCCEYRDSLAVIDCTSDTILRMVWFPSGTRVLYGDSACDKVYGADYGYLRMIRASIDTLYESLSVWNVTALIDNGKQGPANRLYCADYTGDAVTVVAAYKTDSIIRAIEVGGGPVALAWNPLHSWVYVSNSWGSSITVIRDTMGPGPGVEEVMSDERGTMNVGPTVIRGTLNLQPAIFNLQSEIVLLSADGRKVMDLKPGANDVRHLSPGVYFVRDEGPWMWDVGRTRKVVVTR